MTKSFRFLSLFASLTLALVAAGCAASYGADDTEDGQLGVTTNGTMPAPAEDQAVTTVQQNALPILVRAPRIGEPVVDPTANVDLQQRLAPVPAPSPDPSTRRPD
jgi:hypothetical protein